MRPPASFVRAMRSIIYIVSIGLLVVASHPVSAGIAVGGPACDFVTGGGFIVGAGASSLAFGASANFGVGGGVKNGAFWGHLETGYLLGTNNPSTDRVITGTARINGVDGFTYMVEVTDNGEPGRGTDKFSITLSNGGEFYEAGSNYGDGPIAGGNIQLHKANPSNTPPPGVTCP